MIQGEGFFSVEFRSSRNIILIDNGQLTIIVVKKEFIL